MASELHMPWGKCANLAHLYSLMELSRGLREWRTPRHFGNVIKAPFCALI